MLAESVLGKLVTNEGSDAATATVKRTHLDQLHAIGEVLVKRSHGLEPVVLEFRV